MESDDYESSSSFIASTDSCSFSNDVLSTNSASSNYFPSSELNESEEMMETEYEMSNESSTPSSETAYEMSNESSTISSETDWDSDWDDFMISSVGPQIFFPRKIWVDPFFYDRKRAGEYHRLCEELEDYPDKFYSYYRMSPQTYKYILDAITPRLKKHSPFRECICPGEKLSVTLRYLTTGMSLRALELAFRISHSTLSKIIEEVFDAIWVTFVQRHMPVPGEYKLRQIAEEFEELCQFPNCLGAVDGKHIRIFAPDNSVSTYYNYKGYFSTVLQAVADARYRFTFVEVGGYGRQSDGGTFEASSLHKIIEDGTLPIPPPKNLRHSPEIAIPFIFIADDAYPTTSYLIKPYKYHLNALKEIFNGRLSRARRCVECAFGILAAKFRIFYRPIDLKLRKLEKLVKCATLLHNIIIDVEGVQAEEAKNRWPVKSSAYQDFEHFEDEEYEGIAINGGFQIRDTLKNYFAGKGAVPWQRKYIKKLH